MEKQNNAHREEENSSKEKVKDKTFFLNKRVARSCHNPIQIIFQTLLLNKKVKQQHLADFLGSDKGYISRVVNGLQIPPLSMRIKIASFFGVDSSLIWRYQDLPFIKKIIKEQKEI